MSIRIYSEGLSGTAATQTNRTDETSRAQTGKQAGAASSGSIADEVQISSLSEGLTAASNQGAERVQQLSALYQSGKYYVDSQALSRAIVSHALASGSAESGS